MYVYMYVCVCIISPFFLLVAILRTTKHMKKCIYIYTHIHIHSGPCLVEALAPFQARTPSNHILSKYYFLALAPICSSIYIYIQIIIHMRIIMFSVIVDESVVIVICAIYIYHYNIYILCRETSFMLTSSDWWLTSF